MITITCESLGALRFLCRELYARNQWSPTDERIAVYATVIKELSLTTFLRHSIVITEVLAFPVDLSVGRADYIKVEPNDGVRKTTLRHYYSANLIIRTNSFEDMHSVLLSGYCHDRYALGFQTVRILTDELTCMKLREVNSKVIKKLIPAYPNYIVLGTGIINVIGFDETLDIDTLSTNDFKDLFD